VKTVKTVKTVKIAIIALEEARHGVSIKRRGLPGAVSSKC
jgi:hypothetical protein